MSVYGRCPRQSTLSWPRWWCLFLHCLQVRLLFVSAYGRCSRQSTLLWPQGCGVSFCTVFGSGFCLCQPMEGALDRALSHGHSGVVSLSALSLDLSSVCVSLWKLLETEYSLVATLVVSLSALSLDLSSVSVSLWKLLETEHSYLMTVGVVVFSCTVFRSVFYLCQPVEAALKACGSCYRQSTLTWPHCWWCCLLHCL